ncbi:hypothetical protein [Erythrobacter aureus]|uniref:Uncharacterized protein n=1 Tax=Erythrobacter aureus TaxID=2182384 RepID=A0A345YIU8_9SPHN|nr:hypothetical protein [Erythrobacter aureus]AXK43850.1 hypothetical protein DVR09_15460 [Erythrobacter aureus]
MALAQLASTGTIDFAALIQASKDAYHEAIRDVALEALEGEDNSDRIAGLAHAYGIDLMSVTADVENQIDLLKN